MTAEVERNLGGHKLVIRARASGRDGLRGHWLESKRGLLSGKHVGGNLNEHVDQSCVPKTQLAVGQGVNSWSSSRCRGALTGIACCGRESFGWRTHRP